MRSRLLLGLPLVVLLAVGSAAPAHAEARGRIVGIEPQDGAVQVVFTVAGLAPGGTIDPSSLSVDVDGQTVDASVEGASQENRVDRYVMLVIDTSGSMAGDGIAGARAAAAGYLDAVPADVQVGLVTFADTAELRVAVTTDRAAVRSVVESLQVSGDTALYDAVSLASQSLPAEGDRQILLLSDGADEGSVTTLPDITALLAEGDAALNAVAFQNTEVESTLGQLTGAAGGRVVSAQESAGLSAAFTQAATELDKQVVVTASLPEGFAEQEATLRLSATAGGEQVSDTALVAGLRPAVVQGPTADFGPRPATVATGPLTSTTTLYAALAAMFFGLLFVLSTALGGLVTGRREDTVEGRLSPYTLRRQAAQPTAPRGPDDDRSPIARSALSAADRVVRSRGLEEGLGRRLQAGGIPLKPAEWVLVHAGAVLCVPMFVLLITNANLVLVGAALVLAAVGPLGYLSFKQGRRKRAFLAQLPDVLQLLSGSLSSGYSLPQAVDAVVRQGNEPVATEFNKALVEARLGAPIEDSLDDVATRMQSVDFHWVVMAVRIQRDVGGNLSEILSTVSATLRERERLRRQVQVLSAEGRLSAWILGGLPPVFGLYLLAAQPDYLNPLFTTALGLLMLGFMTVLMAVGILWLRKVVKVEV